MSNKIIKILKLPNGKEPFNAWLKKVKDKKDRMRILRRIDRLSIGNYGDKKQISTRLFELRLHFGSGYRIYFTEDAQNIVILLLGGDKSSQTNDIKTAKRYLLLLNSETDYE